MRKIGTCVAIPSVSVIILAATALAPRQAPASLLALTDGDQCRNRYAMPRHACAQTYR
jgi:hypothetical protein